MFLLDFIVAVLFSTSRLAEKETKIRYGDTSYLKTPSVVIIFFVSLVLELGVSRFAPSVDTLLNQVRVGGIVGAQWIL